jgi:hypothetical protein
MRIVTKLLRAAAVAVVVEMMDPVLDRVGISEERSPLARALLKSSVAVVSGVVLGKVLRESDERGDGSSEPSLTVAANLTS